MRFVYRFDEGNKDMKQLLGGKGANLAEMRSMKLPVPDGFTVTTEACLKYYEDGQTIDPKVVDQIFEHVAQLEASTGKQFDSDTMPLFVSVRSGAAISMPGMMDTILNLGMNDRTAAALAKLSGNEQFAYICYARFIQMYSDIVLELPKYHFDAIADVTALQSKSVPEIQQVIKQFKQVVATRSEHRFPENPKEQLIAAVEAVFRSWNNPRAKTYRAYAGISDRLGTAVNVQSMVFGNLGDDSGTGVVFSRNPSTGEKKLFGEFLVNAQGEDVVAGLRTPQKIDTLEAILPDAYHSLVALIDQLERHYKDMQDIEFTVERGKLYLLQTRNGKRTAEAALRIASEMIGEQMIAIEEGLMRLEPNSLNQLLHPQFDPEALAAAPKLTKGLPASPGAATGRVFFDPNNPLSDGILMRNETSPEDIEAMLVARGIVTAKGGMTSHAAVVARGMGKSCVAGAGEIIIHEHKKTFSVGGKEYQEGEWISIDGSTGQVYLGKIETREAVLSDAFVDMLGHADRVRRLGVRANADTPKDAATAVKLGAEGIGLCRTEHMFFDEKRIVNVRRMILAENTQERQEALDLLLPYQKEDFVGILRAMGERPITIRLLDPPLHEFLPNKPEEIKALAQHLGRTEAEIQHKIQALHEVNPMLGHRGCRLAVTYPEIYRMQVVAITEAVRTLNAEGQKTHVEIMIPLIGTKEELEMLRKLVGDIVGDLGLPIGTMIEVPRAALTADQVAEHADFFSFGTNDLTQMTLGISRDDGPKFIGAYKEKGIFEVDPFERLDEVGVGQLVRMACEKGRATNPNIHLGVCGEHGGDPSSIDFFHRTGLDYVSCSPYRVPIARLAAAQAAIRNR